MTQQPGDLKISMWDDEDADEQLAATSPQSPADLLRGTNHGSSTSQNGASAPSGAIEPLSPTALPGTPAGPWLRPETGINGHARLEASPTGSILEAIPAAATVAATGIDWQLVAAFRARASTQLTQAIQSRESLTTEAQRELGRSIILDLLDSAAQEAISTGAPVFTPEQQQRMAQAVFDALFGLGRLQPLVDDDGVENIEVDGCDDVLLEYTDGSLKTGPPIAENDAELIEALTFLASRSEGNARSFSEARPRLHMRLDGGARLAATAWVTPRPTVLIRRHRLTEVTFEDLVARGTASPVMASFMRAGVRAKKSIVVSGPQGGGKTTTVRALCACLDPLERIGTFETEYELHLHELKDKHRRVVAWEARPGSGERGPDGRPAGEINLDELLYDSFRFNLSRQIVGEVRGPEVIAMIKAMQSGAGSISTTHAANAVGAIRKLITCAMEAGPHITESYAQRAIGEHIDLIAHMSLVDTRGSDGVYRRQRFISEVIAVHPGENGPASTYVFRSDGFSPGRAQVLPDDLIELERFGFDLAGFYAEAGGPA